MNPLDQLADITPPDSVSIWPLAWGYWVAIGILLVTVVLCAFTFIKFRNKRKAKRIALVSLATLDTQNIYFAHNIHVIMKTLCSHYLPASSSSQMYGKHWQTLVLSIYKGKEPERLSKAIDYMYSSLYSPDAIQDDDVSAQNENVKNVVTEWVSSSFPCKKEPNNTAVECKVETLPLGEVPNA